MKIVELRAENVKRLSAVEIKPSGSVVTISGRNGQGKTSVLDAIAYALGGKNVIAKRPIREGCERAEVVVDLGDIVVTRTWSSNDKTYLRVDAKDGRRFASPQAILDELVGELTFDPLAFARMEPKEQSATLKRIAGLDFAELDQQREDAFNRRTGVNRELKAAEIELSRIASVDDAPDEEVSIMSLAKEHSDAMALIRANELKRNQLRKTRRDIESLTQEIQEVRERLAALESALADTQNREIVEASHVSKLRDPDVDAIAKRLETAEETNRLVRQKKTHTEKLAKVKTLRKEADSLTRQIEKCDETKRAMLKDAKLPVPGLSFTSEGIFFDGIPFEQASAAEQLKVSAAIGWALNPKLRVMLVRDGSLLDQDSLETLAGMAQAADGQLWIERVADGEGVGIIIEDGQVNAAASLAT